jgi:hypothetical protein
MPSVSHLVVLSIEADFEAQFLQQCLESVEQAFTLRLAQSQQEAEVDLVIVFIDAVVAQYAFVSCEQCAERREIGVLSEANDVVEELNVCIVSIALLACLQGCRPYLHH